MSPALVVLLLGGLALRVTIAYVLFPASGFESDLSSYASWAATLADHGPASFYDHAGFSDYPPAYLYLLWLVGLASGTGGDPGELVKLPPILLDVAVGYVIYRLVRGWTWPGARSEVLALGAAAIYVFNPVAFYDSALWGQTDAAGALVLLLGAAALVRGNSEGAAALAAMAALVKPQFGVVLIPLVAFVLVKRHLLRPGSGPRREPWAPAPVAGWLTRQQGRPRLLTSLLSAIATFYVVALPFGLGIGYDAGRFYGPVVRALEPFTGLLGSIPEVVMAPALPFLEYVERMTETAGGYGYLTVNAFNLWALVGLDGAPSLAEALTWTDDTLPLLGPVPAVAVGVALLAAGFLWGTVRGAVRDDRWTLLVAVTFLAIAFFILPTRVHERYIFPAIALMPLLAAVSRRWGLALLALSVGALINLHGVLTLPLYGTENVEDLLLGEWFRSGPLIVTSVLLQTGVGLWVAWQLRPSLRTSPDDFDRQVTVVAAPMREPPGGVVPAGRAPDSYPTTAPGPEPWVRGPGALDWIIARLSRVPLRRDRSTELATERGGRIDRLDLLVAVVLIVFAVTIRGYRLDQPAGMYFDEVYHARTATEFLQHWEYGEPHAIYEFTHPHLAKYAMAWGIRLAGGNKVTGTAELGVPAVGAALERRWAPPDEEGVRNGDRLYVGSGEALYVYDLATRDLVDALAVAATAMAMDQDSHTLYLADPTGAIYVLDAEALDTRRAGFDVGPGLRPLSPGPGAPVQQLVVSDVSLLAITAGSITSFDPESGTRYSERFVFDATDATALPSAERLVVDAGAAERPQELAEHLAMALDRDAGDIEAILDPAGPVVLGAYLDESERSAVESGIEDGSLQGASLDSGPLLAVADASGVKVLDAWTLDLIDEIATDEPVTALMLVGEGLDEPVLYASAGAALQKVALSEAGPGLPQSIPMPGAIRDLVWNEPANLVHALGEAPGGGPTVYVVEPHGDAVFIDVPLPVEPVHLLADTQPERPASDRSELLAITADGEVTSVGIGQNAFGWRLPGVLVGALAAALVYLLARVLFARRSIGLIAAVLVLAEGMLFANSRIAMNDVYVGFFIVAAALLFAPLWLAPRRPWTAAALLLATGVALGLALASKWVALYAIGGFGLLVLLRSGLGRILALVGMIGLTAVLGAMAFRPTIGDDPQRNWIFLLLMLLVTGLLTAGIVRRPQPVTKHEAALAVVGPLVVGLGLGALGLWAPEAVVGEGAARGLMTTDRLLLAGGLSMLVGVAAGAVTLVAAARGRMGSARAATDGSTSAWFRPGRLLGLPWLFTLAALTVVPVGVYVVSYAPWVELGNQWGLPLVGSLPFLPQSSEGGRTLADLTGSMYAYHDNLRAGHAASSPWWAWPLDLKPVWFFQERYAGSTTALIYDTSNLVIFWLGIAGMAFSAWAAWHRRSLALGFVVIMWAALWLPWARVDRASFQYHVYASLPFLVLALSYLLAELWHGPSARTWFLARAAAALAILAAPLLWLLRTPLCILAGTAVTHPDSVACSSEVTRTAQLSQAGTTAMFVVAAGAACAGFLGWRASRVPPDPAGGGRAQAPWMVALALVVLATLGGVLAALLTLDTGSPVAVTLTSDVLALMAVVVLAIPAWAVIRARDSRRLVLGVLAAAGLWLLVWYPNLAGLPLPSDFAHLYQGLLPTWSWDFQFAVNTDESGSGSLIGVDTLVIGAVTTAFMLGVGVAARLWGRTDPDPEAAVREGAAFPGATPPSAR